MTEERIEQLDVQAFVKAWAEKYGERKESRAQELAALATERGLLFPVVSPAQTERSNQTRIGSLLLSVSGRTFGGWVVRSFHDRVHKYWLEAAPASSSVRWGQPQT